MISKIAIEEINSLTTEEKIIASFQNFYSKRENTSFYKINNTAFFISHYNNSNWYELMIYFKSLENINDTLLKIKSFLNNEYCLLYFRGNILSDLLPLIDKKIIKKEILSYSLKQTISPIEISNKYTLSEIPLNKELEIFFLESFKDEWDENVGKWMVDFQERKVDKNILALKFQDKIASAVMYWVLENTVYIFLIGTKPKYTRQKLAHFLLKEVQHQFLGKTITLTVFSDTNARMFYDKLGFVNKGVVNIII